PVVMIDFDVRCPGFSVFKLTYTEESLAAFEQLDDVAYAVYTYVILYFSPFAIVTNIFSACILLTKELRNPFNFLLSLMCFEVVIPLLIRATMEYRYLSFTECSEYTVTYSFELHSVIAIISWTPF
ncbi:hypothetical protein PMAYCL1PPCAC_00385, partial [Pristionchus mayeri]